METDDHITDLGKALGMDLHLLECANADIQPIRHPHNNIASASVGIADIDVIMTRPMPAHRQVINTTAKPITHDRDVYLPCRIQRCDDRKVHRVKRKLEGTLKHRDRAGVPECLRAQAQADFYIGLVADEFMFNCDIETKEIIIRALGGDDKDVRSWQRYPTSESIVAWASPRMRRSHMITALVLGVYMGIKPEYCFETFPASADMGGIGNHPVHVQDRVPVKVEVGTTCFRLVAKDVQYIDGVVEQAVCHYSDGINDIFVLAVPVKDSDGRFSLNVGTGAASAYLLCHDMMMKARHASILICPCLRTYMKLRRLAQESRLFERTGVIVSGFVGGRAALKALLLSDVAGHKVVIASSPGQEGWDSVESLAQGCLNKGALDVRIYPYPLVTGLTQDANLGYEAQVLTHIIDLDTIELLSHVVARIFREARSLDNFLVLEEKGFAASENSAHEQSQEPEIRLVAFGDLPDSPSRERDKPIAIHEMFNAHNTTLIWGPSNAGKSWLGIDAAISLATGTPYLYWLASSACRVAYLDAEVGPDFKERGKQLIKGREQHISLLNKNLCVLPIKGGIDLTAPGTQGMVISALLEAKVEHVFIDNILSLFPNAAKSNAKHLFEFIHKVEALGIGVIVLHHADKTGKEFKGPSDLVALCQNVIHLEGREQLEMEISKEANSERDGLRAVLAEDGPTVRVTIDKCKVAPELERRQMVYKLRVGEGWEFVEGDLASMSAGCPEERPLNVESGIPIPSNVRLAPDSAKLLECMVAGKTYSRVDLEAVADFKEDRVRRALKPLLANGAVIREGEGKAIYYYKE